MEATAEKKHALLGASSAKRWMHCSPSARAEEALPDGGSDFAREGTAAHALAAYRLRERLGYDTSAEEAELAELSAFVGEEMDGHADGYAGLVWEHYLMARERTPDARLLVEARVDYSRWVPEGFGTVDAAVIEDGALSVYDLKYGKGVRVEAEGNEQMMCYALGALEAWGDDYGVERVSMTIVQPRLDNVSSWQCSAPALRAWAATQLAPAARKAWMGEGEAAPGEWCRFCKARGCCRALAQAGSEGAESAPLAPWLLMSDGEVAAMLPKVDAVKGWCEAVQAYALARACSGAELPGWKVVEGRSARKITDQAAAASALIASGCSEEDVYKPLEMRGITDLEKRLGKDMLDSVAGAWIDKPKGSPTLAPESDRRRPIKLDPFAGIDLKNA